MVRRTSSPPLCSPGVDPPVRPLTIVASSSYPPRCVRGRCTGRQRSSGRGTVRPVSGRVDSVVDEGTDAVAVWQPELREIRSAVPHVVLELMRGRFSGRPPTPGLRAWLPRRRWPQRVRMRKIVTPLHNKGPRHPIVHLRAPDCPPATSTSWCASAPGVTTGLRRYPGARSRREQVCSRRALRRRSPESPALTYVIGRKTSVTGTDATA